MPRSAPRSERQREGERGLAGAEDQGQHSASLVDRAGGRPPMLKRGTEYLVRFSGADPDEA
eukprot:9639955-Alexandrium_andersonii.AAC.1